MANNKKYYYLKLKDNFFDSDEMKLLEGMPEGYKYSNILLKLYLRSLKDDGRLMLNNHIPYSEQMIASVTGHSVGDVTAALSVFQDLGLIEKLDNGAIYMLDIQNFIGQSSTEAERKKAYRNKIKSEKGLESSNQQAFIEKSGQMSGQTSDNRTPEIEKEIEIDKDSSSRPPRNFLGTHGKSLGDNFGEKIYLTRLKMKLSQEEFGKLFDPPADKSIVSRWEKGISEPSKERIKTINGFSDNSSQLLSKDPWELWQENWGFPNSIAQQDLLEWCKQFGNDLVYHAIEYALKSNVTSKGADRYLERIFDSYQQNQIDTVAKAVENEEQHYQQKTRDFANKKQYSNKYQPRQKEQLPDWAKDDHNTADQSDDEQPSPEILKKRADIERRLKESGLKK